MEQLKRLIREIHRRSLWQVLLIYVAASWAVLEAADVLIERLSLPDWIYGFAIILLLVGLPIVLATAFVQEGATAAPAPGPEAADEAPDVPGRRGPRRFFTWRNALLGGLLAFSLWGLVATAWLVFDQPASNGGGVAEVPTDPDVVAVFPFRVSGNESEFGHLREGMVDLLAAKFNGEGGPRAADPRSVIAAWQRVTGPASGEVPRDTLLDLARDLGAGQVLLGGIVAAPSRLVLNATVLAVPTGRIEAEASVEGPPDSLLALIDDLTARLLVREAGESASRLAALTSKSLPALRAYLDGQAAYRRGAYEQAVTRFDRALEFDSTFALAGLAQVSAANWTLGRMDSRNAIARVWPHRDRLSERDRLLLEALAGPRYPDQSPAVEVLAAWDRALEAAPERPEPWVDSGDLLFHSGRMLPRPDPWVEAEAHFRRALELDSSFTTPLIHLIELEILDDDLEEVERLGTRYLQIDSAGDLSDFMRWRIGHALGDSASLARIRSRFSEMSRANLIRIIGIAQLDGFALKDAEAAARALVARPGTAEERGSSNFVAYSLALNRGRPADTHRILRPMLEQMQHAPRDPGSRLFAVFYRLDGLYWAGDSMRVASMVPPLPGAAELRDPGSLDANVRARVLCGMGQWHLWQEETAAAEEVIRALRGIEDPAAAYTAEACSVLLEALRAGLAGREDAVRAVARLDSLMQTGPGPADLWASANLVLAGLWEMVGEADRALAALRRREYHWLLGTLYLSSYLREEGRLAARVGDREGAIRAYRHYLNLRSDPEPSVAPEVELVRDELARLVAEGSGP